MRGGDTRKLRAYNERMIVQAIRSFGPLSKAEIARATGLSAQAAAVIVNALLEEGLLIKEPKVRGRIGQPQTPLALNPQGVYSLGVKIGRRSVEALVIDFLGAPVSRWEREHDAPLPEIVMDAAGDGVRAVLDGAPEGARDRLAGLGVAMPGHFDMWWEELGLPPNSLAAWSQLDPAAALAEETGLESVFCNDATAACAAELALGGAISAANTLYIYIATFVGGGVVIDGQLQHGPTGNAGAIGSLPVAGRDVDGRPRQLIHDASLITLERAMLRAGLDSRAHIHGTVRSDAGDAMFATWMETAAAALARACAAACSVMEFEMAVIDGVLNPVWRDRLVTATREAMAGMNLAGLSPLRFAAGETGPGARVLGAAFLPLHGRFSAQAAIFVRDLAHPAET
ncbi:transcriptional regulator, MarR family [Albimonas donghaensis]|uniref:Transcriptional regulator, MarR family n=1 Tax=Albimonas donghaensis TaxID=356660 RepID=A0A1H3BLH5_9RHOB|nr:ROK family transcriptional regulator [Albimonas donghaensis]SDX42635.1 transcriptional regulator, MarR family [Albimonas donghaensis]